MAGALRVESPAPASRRHAAGLRARLHDDVNLVADGAQNSGVWRSVTGSVRRSPPASVHVLWTSDRGAVSSPTHGPPKGQPVPVDMSTPTSRRGLAQRVVQHRHPLRRQIWDEAVFRAANAVDGRNLDAADSGGRERLQLRNERTPLDRAAHHHRVQGLVSGGNRRPSARPLSCCALVSVNSMKAGAATSRSKTPASRDAHALAEFNGFIDVKDSQARCWRRVRAVCASHRRSDDSIVPADHAPAPGSRRRRPVGEQHLLRTRVQRVRRVSCTLDLAATTSVPCWTMKTQMRIQVSLTELWPQPATMLRATGGTGDW